MTPTPEQMALVAHEMMRVYCQSHGDPVQPPWDFAAPEIRASAIAGVEFTLANPNAGDSAQHEQRMRDKLAAGWVYGPVKDAEAKTHPCLVPFGQLPAHQQLKDRLFRTAVLSMAECEG